MRGYAGMLPLRNCACQVPVWIIRVERPPIRTVHVGLVAGDADHDALADHTRVGELSNLGEGDVAIDRAG